MILPLPAPALPRRHRLLLLLILLLAFGLRLYRLGQPGLWYDETVSLYLAGLDLPAMLAHTAGDIHPPLYYALLHFWTGVAGRSEFAAAFLSLCFGLLLVALTYRIAATTLGSSTGLWAAFLVAISPFHLWYSQEVRMYTLGAGLGLVSLWCLLRWEEWARRWLAWVGVTAAGLYTLYYYLFLIVFENLFVFACWLGSHPKRGKTPTNIWLSQLRPWLLAQATVVVLYLPWLPVAWRQATEPPVPPWRGFIPLDRVLVESWTTLTLGQSVSAAEVWPLLLLAGVLYLVGLRRVSRPALAFLLVGYTFVPVLLIALLSLVTPLYHVRYVFPYAVPFTILLAAGLDRSGWGRLKTHPTGLALQSLTMILLTGASLYAAGRYWFAPELATDDLKGAVRTLVENALPGDAVLVNAGYAYPAVVYYAPGAIAWRGRITLTPGPSPDIRRGESLTPGPLSLPPVNGGAGGGQRGERGLVVLQTGSLVGSDRLGWGSPTSDFYRTTLAEETAALERVAAQHPRLWHLRLYDTVTDPGGALRQWLDQRFQLLADWPVAGSSFARLQLYDTRPGQPPADTLPRLNVTLGNRVRLLAAETTVFDPDVVNTSGLPPLGLVLYWQALTPLPADYHLFARLEDDAGRVWSQWDRVAGPPLLPPGRWPAGETIRDGMALTPDIGTPPGRYRLVVGLYDPATGVRLTTPAGNDTMRIGQVTLPRRLPVDVRRLTFTARPEANLDNAVTLVGAVYEPRPYRPGEPLGLSLYWQARRGGLPALAAFVQVQDETGRVWAAAEGPPAAGLYPTDAWASGDLVRDPYELTLPATLAPGRYRLVAGMYRIADRARLPVQRWPFPPIADQVIVGELRVSP